MPMFECSKQRGWLGILLASMFVGGFSLFSVGCSRPEGDRPNDAIVVPAAENTGSEEQEG